MRGSAFHFSGNRTSREKRGCFSRGFAFACDLLFAITLSWFVAGFPIGRQLSAAGVADVAHVAQAGQRQLCKSRKVDGPPEELSPTGERIRQLQRFGEKSRRWCVGLRSPGGDWSSGVLVGDGQWILTVAHGFDADDDAMEVIFADGVRGRCRVVRREVAAVPVAIDGGAVLTGDVPRDEVAPLSEVAAYLALGFIGGVESKGQEADRRMGFGYSRFRDGMLVTTCALGPGASGGPVFPVDGRLVGINRTMESEGDFATHVPIGRFLEVWPELRGALLNTQAYPGADYDGGCLADQKVPVMRGGVSHEGTESRSRTLVASTPGIGLWSRLARGDLCLTQVAGRELPGAEGSDAELHRQDYLENELARRALGLRERWRSVFEGDVPTADCAGRGRMMVGAAQFLTVSAGGCGAGQNRAMRAMAVSIWQRDHG